MSMLCYLNGDYLPLDEARIPVLDRGFIFGDGVYEVIPVFGGHPFRLRQHLDRLARSLREIGLHAPLSPAQWQQILRTLSARNSLSDFSLYLQITRGVAPRNHAAPEHCVPTVFAMVSPLPADQTEAAPVGVVTMTDLRWQRCDIKSVSLLPNVLARTAAVAAGAYEAVLFREDLLTEGSSSNVFVVTGGHIRTPPHSGHILPGITRDALVEALAQTADRIEETPVTRAEVMAAEEIWLTSSTRDLVPVGTIDGRPVGKGAPGAVFRRVLATYGRFKARELSLTAGS